jgi:hypothetical protein
MFAEEKLVTVATFHSESEVLLARTRLESADIECFVPDEHMLHIAGWHAGRVRLQVRESDAQDAQAILNRVEPHTGP